MRIFKKSLCCLSAFVFTLLIIYTDILFSFPTEITMYENEVHNRYFGIGISMDKLPAGSSAEASRSTVIPTKCGTYDAMLKAANIPFRSIKVTVKKPQELKAAGNLIGLKIYNKGLIVTNLAPVISGGEETSPAQAAGILPGDIIIRINETTPKTSEDVPHLLSGKTKLSVLRNGTLKTFTLSPVTDDSDGNPKLGIWVRDSSAGVGTMTYINPQNLSYGALGHGISDSDTGILFDVAAGSIEKSRVISITKGKRGTPGQICGSFSSIIKSPKYKILKDLISKRLGSLRPLNSTSSISVS